MTFPLMPFMLPSSGKAPTAALAAFRSGNVGGSFTIGAPTSAERFVVYATSNQNGPVNLTSCTMNGIAAQIANAGNASFACAKIPTGTTVDIATTYSVGGGTGSSYIGGVYVVYDLESPAWRQVAFNIGNPSSASLLVPEKGLIIAPVQISNDNQSAVFSTGMTRDANGDNGNSYGFAMAHHNAFLSSASYSVTCAVSSGTCFMGAGVLR